MKTFASTHSHTQNSVKEHTPIYDLVAYQQHQHKIKRQKFVINLVDTIILIGITAFTFSTFFWGV